MSFNILKKYNDLLDIGGLSPRERKISLLEIFNRDIANNTSFKFNTKQITPTPKDGVIKMDTLYNHLTTVIVDKKTRARDFDMHRSKRLHWVKYHIDEKKKTDMLCFTVKEPEGNRTYIYDKTEKYVIVLEPLRNGTEYYLLSAYYVQGKDARRNKIERKYRRKLDILL